MRSTACCFAVLLCLPLVAQQKSEPKPAKTSASDLNAEGYRDLIVNTADTMTLGKYLSPGTGIERGPNWQERHCIMTFTFTESAAQDFASQRKTWADARVPPALKASHAEILEWIETLEANIGRMPKCIEPLMQSSAEQLTVFGIMGRYDELRKNAATALAGIGVTLPPNASAKN